MEEDLTICPENDTCSIDVTLYDVETGDVIMNLTFCSSADPEDYDSCAENIVRKQTSSPPPLHTYFCLNTSMYKQFSKECNSKLNRFSTNCLVSLGRVQGRR